MLKEYAFSSRKDDGRGGQIIDFFFPDYWSSKSKGSCIKTNKSVSMSRVRNLPLSRRKTHRVVQHSLRSIQTSSDCEQVLSWKSFCIGSPNLLDDYLSIKKYIERLTDNIAYLLLIFWDINQVSIPSFVELFMSQVMLNENTFVPVSHRFRKFIVRKFNHKRTSIGISIMLFLKMPLIYVQIWMWLQKCLLIQR